LEDVSFRAIRILKEVDLILAEDTRTSARLLQEYNVATPMRSFHLHNEHKVLSTIINDLKSGRPMALISDAGTPGISDPGFLLVRACVEEGIDIECLPGASALLPAIAVSGLPMDRFVFEGFLPPKKGRRSRLQELSQEKRTIVVYEAPHRLLKTLKEFAENFGEERKASVSREISKFHEQHHRGSLSELILEFEETPPRGEIVVVVEGLGKIKKSKE
jgi:16S rRNA (cytidine1402-2'-O)-methyltransferase